MKKYDFEFVQGLESLSALRIGIAEAILRIENSIYKMRNTTNGNVDKLFEVILYLSLEKNMLALIGRKLLKYQDRLIERVGVELLVGLTKLEVDVLVKNLPHGTLGLEEMYPHTHWFQPHKMQKQLR